MELVYQRYNADVLALAAAMLGNQEAAWDVLHDVFVAVARTAPGLAPDSNLKGYLLTAAANTARDLLSKRSAGPLAGSAVESLEATHAEDPAEIAGKNDEAANLRAAIAALPEEQRIVLALRIYGEMPFAQIAAREDVPEKTVQSRYRYAIEKLRRNLLRGGQ